MLTQDFRGYGYEAADPTVPTTLCIFGDAASAKGAHHPPGLGQGPGQSSRYSDGSLLPKTINTASGEGAIMGAHVPPPLLGEGISGGDPRRGDNGEVLPPPGTVNLVKPRVKRIMLKVRKYMCVCVCGHIGGGIHAHRGTCGVL